MHFTHPRVVPNPYVGIFSMKHKRNNLYKAHFHTTLYWSLLRSYDSFVWGADELFVLKSPSPSANLNWHVVFACSTWENQCSFGIKCLKICFLLLLQLWMSCDSLGRLSVYKYSEWTYFSFLTQSYHVTSDSTLAHESYGLLIWCFLKRLTVTDAWTVVWKIVLCFFKMSSVLNGKTNSFRMKWGQLN